MPLRSIMSAWARTSTSVTLHPTPNQLFQPMGGTGARKGSFPPETCPRQPAPQSMKVNHAPQRLMFPISLLPPLAQPLFTSHIADCQEKIFTNSEKLSFYCNVCRFYP